MHMRQKDSGSVRMPGGEDRRLQFRAAYAARLLLAAFLMSCAPDIPAAESGVVTTPGDSWTMFRGNTYLTGVTESVLPDKLEVLWTYQAGEDGLDASACIADGGVFVGDFGETFHAVDFETGKPLWTTEIGAPVTSSAAWSDGRLFFGDEYGFFHCLDSKTGEEIWKLETDAEVICSPNVVGDRVLFGSYDQYLYSCDVKTGEVIWRTLTEGPVHCTPGVVDGLVYIAGCDGVLRAINFDDGTEASKFVIGAYVGAAPARLGNKLFFGTFNQDVACVDLDKGAFAWLYDPEPKDFDFFSSAAIAKDRIVLGGRDRLVHCIAIETGTEIWRYQAKGRVDSSPVISGNRVFVGSNDGRLREFDLETGKLIWEFEAGESIVASPAVARGRLIIGSQDGTLYCFGAKP